MAERSSFKWRYSLIGASGVTALALAVWVYLGWVLPHADMLQLRTLNESTSGTLLADDTIPKAVRHWVKTSIPSANESVEEWSKTRVTGFEVWGAAEESMRAALPALSRQTHLEHLLLADCSLRDTDLPSFSRLTRLKLLALSGTQVSENGRLRLDRHPALEALDLSRSHITDEGLMGLDRLVTLKDFDLSETKVSGSRFPMLPQLKFLKVDGCPLTPEGLGRIAQQPALESLRIGTLTEDDFELLYPSRILQLDLDRVEPGRATSNRLERSGDRLPFLKRARIANCDAAGVRTLATCPELRGLYVQDLKVDVSEFNHFPSLTHLAIYKASLPLDSLRHLRPLLVLHLENARFGDTELEALSHSPAAKTLTELDLHGSFVTDAGLKYLTAFPKLTLAFVGAAMVSTDGAVNASAELHLSIVKRRSSAEYLTTGPLGGRLPADFFYFWDASHVATDSDPADVW